MAFLKAASQSSQTTVQMVSIQSKGPVAARDMVFMTLGNHVSLDQSVLGVYVPIHIHACMPTGVEVLATFRHSHHQVTHHFFSHFSTLTKFQIRSSHDRPDQYDPPAPSALATAGDADMEGVVPRLARLSASACDLAALAFFSAAPNCALYLLPWGRAKHDEARRGLHGAHHTFFMQCHACHLHHCCTSAQAVLLPCM